MILYKAPSGLHRFELEVKRSRFIVYSQASTTRADALAFLEDVKQRYPDARHHCWVYVVGKPESPSALAMSDDGEPTGTAAKPMLNAIQHAGVGDVCVVVVRYFGGIKLGAGGLIRAYGGSVAKSLAEQDYIEVREQCELELKLGFESEQRLRHWLDRHNGQLIDARYSEKVSLFVRVEKSLETDLRQCVAAEGGEVLSVFK